MHKPAVPLVVVEMRSEDKSDSLMAAACLVRSVVTLVTDDHRRLAPPEPSFSYTH